MRRWLMAALATFLLSACGERNANNVSGVECVADRDCAGEKVCRASLCTIVEQSPRALGFRLVPPPSSTYPAQTIATHEVEADAPLQIGLDPGVRVAGSLSFVGRETGPDSGRLKFRRHRDDFTSETAVANSKYEIFVPAGTYDITFFPQDVARRPTRVWGDVMIELDTDPRLQIVEQTVEVIGTLSRTDAVSREADFVGNARVFATSADSGITSSVGMTDSSGNFKIAVPPNSGVFDLHVSPLEPNSYADNGDADYVPDATYAAAFVVEGNEWINGIEDNQGADVLGVSLGEYAYSPIRIPVRLVIEGMDITDWTGTSVTLRTTAGRGVISVRQRLGEAGEFEIPLIMGLYHAVIRTPPSLPVRSMELSDIEIDAAGIVLRLEARSNVAGRLQAPDGSPLAGAELRFVPSADRGLAQQVSVTTDEDGEYKVWLENEPYLLSAIPADPSLPRYVQLIENADVPPVIEIGEPVLVWGTVFGTPSNGGDGDWVGLPDVSVHVVEADAQRVEQIVGEGQTNERGEFKVVIRARP